MRGGHSETIQTTIFSPDGSMIATSDGQNAKIMRASDGVLLMSIPFGTKSLAFTPDSQTIAALVPPNAPGSSAIQIWSITGRSLVRSIPVTDFSSVAGISFSPDGTKIVAGQHVYIVNDGSTYFYTGTPNLQTMFFSPDGQYIYGDGVYYAGGGNFKDSLVRWSASNPTTETTISFSGYPVAISPDSQYVIIDRGGDVVRVSDGTIVHSFGFSNNWAASYAFTSDGQFLVQGRPNFFGTAAITLTRTSDWSDVWTVPADPAGGFGPINLSTFGNKIAVSFKNTRLLSLADGSVIRDLTWLARVSVSSVAFSADGQILATANGSPSTTAFNPKGALHLWNVADGSRRNVDFPASVGLGVSKIFITPDNQQLLSLDYHNGQSVSIRFWNANDGSLIRTLPQTSSTGALSMSPNGMIYAVGKSGSVTDLYQTSDDTFIRRLSDAAGEGVFSPNNQIFAASSAVVGVNLFNVSDGTLFRNLNYSPDSIAFSPDSQTVAILQQARPVGNLWVSTIKLFRISDGSLLQTFDSVDGRAGNLAFSPDGNSVLASSTDATIHIWRVSDGALVTYNQETNSDWPNQQILSTAYSPDGHYFAYGRFDATVVVAQNPYNGSVPTPTPTPTPSPTPTPTPTPTPGDCTPPSGLVSWWSGEGNANDIQGNNNGTLMNGATFATGMVGQAFNLDGVDDFIEVPNQPSLNPTNQITVEAWYKPTSFVGNGNNPIVDKGYVSHSSPYYQYHLGVTGDLYPHDAGTFSFYVSAGGGGAQAITSNHFWTPGNWYHIVGTYDGAHVNLYVNGVLIDSVAASGLMVDYGRNLRIGAFSNLGGSSSVLPGLVDEVSIYDRALTVTEIQAIHNAGGAGKCQAATTPPTTVAAPNPSANAAGWNNADVNISLAATDGAGGTAIQEIVYSASGAQTIAPTTVNGANANLTVTAEGETTLSYFARDVNGNTEEVKTLTVKIDKTAPVINASRSPNSNGAGWNNSDVTANYTASDSLSGLNDNSQPSGSFIFANEGANQAHTFTVTDVAGNSSTATIENVNIDKAAPSVNCDSADGAWHSTDVSIACTATENISSLVNNTDAYFSLVTNVANGTETANASTGSREVCDIAGNCTTTQPIGGNKIDKKAPSITITTPTGGNYLLNQAVTVAYNCVDGGSGVATCSGTTADGGLLDTASAGEKTFTVSATDNAGNTASPAATNYKIIFGLAALYDQSKSHKLGSSVPIKIRLVDANGVNVSSATTVLHAVSVIQIGSQASGILDQTGNSTSDLDFRYDQSVVGYIFNVSTKGYTTGTYQLRFTAGSGPTIYSVQFQVRE
jgi:hypothetical protein